MKLSGFIPPRFLSKKALFITLIGIDVLIVLFLTLFGLYKVMNLRNFQFFGEIVPRVETQDKVVALTFDDGPNERYQALIDVLQAKGVKATFFVVGQEVDQNPEAIKALISAGHEIGNHSYTHNRMVFKSPEFIATEIEKTDTAIKNAGYDKTLHFRPPFGKKLFILPYYLDQQDRKTIMWDVEPDTYIDYAEPSSVVVEYVKSNTKPGSIILYHPWGGETEKSVEIIAGVVDVLKAEGYEFVTVSELMER